jgi:hypothetical protein
MAHDGQQTGAQIDITEEMRNVGADLIEELSGVVPPSYLAERVYIAMAALRFLSDQENHQ